MPTSPPSPLLPHLALICSCALLLACGSDAKPTPSADAAGSDAPSNDAASGDTPSGDAPSGDAPSGDTPSGDASSPDAGTSDAGSTDTVPTDTVLTDTGIIDTGPASCPGGMGCPCTSPVDCDDSMCVQTPDGGRCTTYCGDGSCPAGWSCAGQKGGSDANSFCARDGGLICRPCTTDEQCQAGGHGSARCVDYGDAGGFCGLGCSSDADCGAGRVCREVGSVQGGVATQQCVVPGDAEGALGLCSCSAAAIAQGLQTSCYVSQGSGLAQARCKGSRGCGSAGLSDCEPLTGEAALCLQAQCLDPVTKLPLSEGAACDDGLPCSPGDACQDGSCKPTSLLDCGCQNDVDCVDDGDLCNGLPYCDKSGTDAAGKPVWQCKVNPATVVSCDNSQDGNCLQTSCEPESGSCKKLQKPAFAPCDDGIACTAGDVCDAEGKCQSGTWTCCKSDADCAKEEDGDLCNGTLFCNLQSGKCEDNPATVVQCPTVDDTACLQSKCQEATGQCALTPVNVGLKCDDGNACSDLDTCDAKGQCKGGKDTCPCKVDVDCAPYDDGDLCNGTLYCNPIAGPNGTGVCRPNPKTVVVCKTVDDTFCSRNRCDQKTGSCAMVDLPAQTTCDADGTACTANDACDGKGACKPGPVVCECQSDADCASKEDGDLCNGTLYCDKSGDKPVCKLSAATVKSCPSVDDTACQKNLCQPKTGGCVLQALGKGAPCSDGEACTDGDGCDGKGQCQPGEQDLCGCKGDGDCVGFDDGDVCNGSYVCVEQACAFTGKALLCDDGNLCTLDSCDKVKGCVHQPKPGCTPCKAKGDCDDANVCTIEVCAGGECFWEPVAVDCDDSNPCTVGDACVAKACQAGSAKSCDDGKPCTDDACDPSEQQGCVHTANTLPCDDGDACTSGDTCGQGACLPGAATVCDDGNLCTDDGCAPDKGCTLANNATPCDADGSVCTEADTCSAGACKAGKVKDCDDGNPCTVDSCDAAQGCAAVALPGCVSCATSAGCDDGNSCTVEVCLQGVCVGVPSSAPCDDGSACTVADACSDGVCKPGEAKSCDDGDPCTVDSCDAVAGCKATAAPDGSSCSADGSQWCQAGTCWPKVMCGPGVQNQCAAIGTDTSAIQLAKVFAADGETSDGFGSKVSLSGARALVGTSGDDDTGSQSGSAYIFEQQVNGSWKQTAKLLAADGAAEDRFGYSVSLSGERALVGAYANDDKGNSSGSAYIFERQGDGSWQQTAKLLAADGAADDQFGLSVSLIGERALVGAYLDDDKGKGSGSAYIFERQGDGSWQQTAKLLAVDGAAGDRFGIGVSLSGERALVGADGNDDKGSSSGSAYIFERQTNGSWKQTAKLLAADGAAFDYLGTAISLSGERALVGRNHDDANGFFAGSAYVFERQANGSWKQTAKLFAADGAVKDYFGNSVSLSGERALVGSHYDDDKGNESGSAYLFERQGDGSWKQAAKLLAADGASIDRFGDSVSLSGERALVGALSGDNDKGIGAGAAYVFQVADFGCKDGACVCKPGFGGVDCGSLLP